MTTLVRLLTGTVLLAISLCCPASADDAQKVSKSGNSVLTTGGRIAGIRLPSGGIAYLGIPYAAPPTQAQRWRPPAPYSWSGIFNADRFGPECIQILRPHNINHYFGEEPTSENCLFLNIWTPPVKQHDKKRPVVVFIHGGGGTVGSAGIALYGGEQVAKHGAIYVSLNYRLGILGFMAHPDLSAEQGGHSGNYGFLDQSFALHWIRDNIEAFGGDRDHVVIVGQSFGASSVAAQMASPLSKGLFQSAVLSSGCNIDSTFTPLSAAEDVGRQIQKRLSASSVAEMRDIPADRLLALQEERQLGANVDGIRLPPTIDGYFLPGSPRKLIESGQYNAVPIIASSNGDDLDVRMNPITRAKSINEFRKAATERYKGDAEVFFDLYPISQDSEVPQVARLAAAEGGFVSGSRNCAKQLASKFNTATYIALFTRKPSFAPGAMIADIDPANTGAYHTADIPFWLGTLDTFNQFRMTRQWTEQDRNLSAAMIETLINFARTGNPSSDKWKWPQWQSNDEKIMVVGDHPTVQTLAPERMEFHRAHPFVLQPPRATAPTIRD